MKPIPEGSFINPYAGSHPITADPREQAAAIRAGDRSVEEFPYYTERYGERGRMFGRSDSAWIARLAEMDEAAVEQHVLWLGGVLSVRGIPQWLLERHLAVLEEELAAAVPEHAERYTVLGRVRTTLRRRLDARVEEWRARALEEEFAASAISEWSTRLPRMGRILVAAVVDESLGIGNAVAAVTGWAADPSRFPPVWIAALERTVAAARREVASRTAG
jgi:hypothetical protein